MAACTFWRDIFAAWAGVGKKVLDRQSQARRDPAFEPARRWKGQARTKARMREALSGKEIRARLDRRK
jgi:hypothetical protein